MDAPNATQLPLPAQQMQQPIGPQQAAQSMDGNIFERLAGDWPLTTERVGKRIQALESSLGCVRHDVIVEKGKVGWVIGPQGSTLKALLASTQCEIFVLDKEGPPPNFGPDQRLICLVGTPEVVAHAHAEVLSCLQSTRATGGKRGADAFGAEDMYGSKRTRS